LRRRGHLREGGRESGLSSVTVLSFRGKSNIPEKGKKGGGFLKGVWSSCSPKIEKDEEVKTLPVFSIGKKGKGPECGRSENGGYKRPREKTG